MGGCCFGNISIEVLRFLGSGFCCCGGCVVLIGEDGACFGGYFSDWSLSFNWREIWCSLISCCSKNASYMLCRSSGGVLIWHSLFSVVFNTSLHLTLMWLCFVEWFRSHFRRRDFCIGGEIVQWLLMYCCWLWWLKAVWVDVFWGILVSDLILCWYLSVFSAFSIFLWCLRSCCDCWFKNVCSCAGSILLEGFHMYWVMHGTTHICRVCTCMCVMVYSIKQLDVYAMFILGWACSCCAYWALCAMSVREENDFV